MTRCNDLQTAFPTLKQLLVCVCAGAKIVWSLHNKRKDNTACYENWGKDANSKHVEREIKGTNISLQFSIIDGVFAIVSIMFCIFINNLHVTCLALCCAPPLSELECW